SDGLGSAEPATPPLAVGRSTVAAIGMAHNTAIAIRVRAGVSPPVPTPPAPRAAGGGASPPEVTATSVAAAAAGQRPAPVGDPTARLAVVASADAGGRTGIAVRPAPARAQS